MRLMRRAECQRLCWWTCSAWRDLEPFPKGSSIRLSIPSFSEADICWSSNVVILRFSCTFFSYLLGAEISLQRWCHAGAAPVVVGDVVSATCCSPHSWQSGRHLAQVLGVCPARAREQLCGCRAGQLFCARAAYHCRFVQLPRSRFA